jgi:putative thioredoxin
MFCSEHARAGREAVARLRGRAIPAGAKWVFDVTDQTFKAKVTDLSQTVPVVVYLHAQWAAPCRDFGLLLEKLATGTSGGGFMLAKIDVDENPGLASAFQATACPMVSALIDGRIVDTFLGAMPENELRQWLDRTVWNS